MSQKRSALPLSAMWSGWRAPSRPTGCIVPSPQPGSVPCATTAPPVQAKPLVAAPCFGAGCHGWGHACTQNSSPSHRLIQDLWRSLSSQWAWARSLMRKPPCVLPSDGRARPRDATSVVLGHYRCFLRCADSLLCQKTHAVWHGEQQRNSVFANNMAR